MKYVSYLYQSTFEGYVVLKKVDLTNLGNASYLGIISEPFSTLAEAKSYVSMYQEANKYLVAIGSACCLSCMHEHDDYDTCACHDDLPF